MKVYGVCCFGWSLWLLVALQAVAGSFESQQKNTTIFDGIKGEQGELLLDATQTNYQWKPASTATGKAASGFAYRKFNGDFILTTQLRLSGIADAKTTFGLQVEALSSQGPALKTRLDAQGNLQVEASGEQKLSIAPGNKVRAPDVVQIERKASELIFSAAQFGQPLQLVARVKGLEPAPLTVGVYRSFSNTDKSVLEMRNLRWVIPIWKNFIPYQEFLGSRLEILDVVTGERRVIYETAAGIEAPNWTSDGENIIYDSAGRIYKLHLPSKKIAAINTGFEVKNNNDHVISYKGKILGITHLEGELVNKGWSIFKMPINGGELQQLTFTQPSYLHGWSPDGRYILYTSERNGEFKLYRGASDGSGEEVQLTFGKGMDDGSEYSPDGKHIYFNSTRSGKMHIWRMDADGKNPIQITNDNYNDWFPHVSPDGKQILFLSYQPDVQADLHPHYQQIYLRSMPITGGEPKIVAYVYGGQGTINVPSWSPDGRYVAFVSNSQLGSEKP